MPPSVIRSTMVKRTKRKIEIKKRDTKQQRSVACSKRRQTLFSKAADLCLLSGANIAIFVISPADNSDVVYSFSGYCPASEIADCYLNGKHPPKTNPQSKLGFWWEDPNLYHCCDDISELNIMEDRIKRMKKDLMACLDKEEKLQLVSNFDQEENPNNCSQSASFDQNPSGSSSQFVSDSDKNPNSWSPSSAEFASSDQTQTQAMINVGGYEDQSFWDNLYNEDAFGLNNGFFLDNNNFQANVMIYIGEFLNE